MTEKPPLGPMPHYIWVEQRINELLRAINEYGGLTHKRKDKKETGPCPRVLVLRWLAELRTLSAEVQVMEPT